MVVGMDTEISLGDSEELEVLAQEFGVSLSEVCRQEVLAFVRAGLPWPVERPE
jgi:hypothetical protein